MSWSEGFYLGEIMKRSDFLMDANELVEKVLESLKNGDSACIIAQSDLDKFYKEREELEKYKWLYKVACEIIHDIDGTKVDEIMKDLDRLWNLKNRLDRRNKNDN